jgi:hypothetical protein
MDNISALKRQVEILLERLQGKRFILEDLNKRLQRAAEEHPYDTVIQATARVVEQMSNKNPGVIISQAEFEKIYNELIGLNVSGTRFREVLGDLLQSEKPASVEPNEKYIHSVRDTEDIMEYPKNESLKGFEQLFNPNEDKYDPKLAANAKEKVFHGLQSLGFNTQKIRLAGGNSRFLVFTADLDTNRGAVRVFIPTESSGKKFPSIFIGGSKFETLTREGINKYLEEASWRNNERLPTISAILDSLDMFTGTLKETTNEEFNKLSSNLPEEGNINMSAPAAFASILDESKIVKDIEVPQVETPEPLKVIATEVEESVLEASTGQPQATVRLAKRMILTELTSMGFKGSQVRVSCPTNDGFICEAILNTPKGKVSIEIPIEINNHLPLIPSVFAKDDYVAEFNAASLQAFAINENGSSNGFVQRESQLYGMDISELKDVIIRAAIKKDFDTCNEAMEVISENVSEEAYRGIVADYFKMISDLGSAKDNLKQAHEDADQFVRTPNSIYPIHKQLGLPAHELVRNSNGEYHRKSTYHAYKEVGGEGAFFSKAKILVGD